MIAFANLSHIPHVIFLWRGLDCTQIGRYVQAWIHFFLCYHYMSASPYWPTHNLTDHTKAQPTS
jgi:hypothetical protein